MRGKKSKTGTTRVAPNGYHYTKVKDKWKLTHHIVMEKKLGRRLKNNERVYFVDGDRTNLAADNLEVRAVKAKTKESVRARLEAKIEDLQAQLEELDA